MTDDLVRRLVDDLDGAFPRLVHAHSDAVFSTALRCGGRWHDAEEVAQEAFARAYRSLRDWPPERILALRPRAWLCTIAANLARNRVRAAGRRPHATEPPAGWEPAADAAEGPAAAAERAEGRRELAAALALLPEMHREAVVLRHVVGLPYVEIAEAHRVPVGTVKARVHRGLRTLAVAMRGEPAEEAS